MTFKKGHDPNRSINLAGRPKGSLNKMPAEAKRVIAECAGKMGGVKRMYAWAMKNDRHETLFWTVIYTKLLPLEVKGSLDVTHDFTDANQELENFLLRRADAIRARDERLKLVGSSSSATPTLVETPRKTGSNGS